MEKDKVFKCISSVLKAEKEVHVTVDEQSSLSTLLQISSGSTAENATIIETFCLELVAVLEKTFLSFGKVRQTLARERALTTFYQLSVSELPDVWKCLAQNLKLPPLNVHQQQSVNRRVFELLLVEKLTPCVRVEDQGSERVLQHKRTSLSPEESIAVRYAAGYVTTKLFRHYTNLNTSKAASFAECLSHMAMVGRATCNDETFYDYTLEWISNIDRGGVFYVNQDTFSLFKAIEIKTQECLPRHLQCSSTSKEKLITNITSDDSIQFLWSLVAIDISDAAEDAELLKELVQTWVTIRGFSMTSTWVEQYKLAQKKSVKRSKRLREGLSMEK